MYDKDELTNATMKVLQGKIVQASDTREADGKQMKRIIENYIKDDDLESFGKIFVTATSDEDLMVILRAIIDQYYNHIRSI